MTALFVALMPIANVIFKPIETVLIWLGDLFSSLF